MPLTPHMSPAAIGCSVVRLRGWPWLSKRAPIAARTASGQPRPDEDETVTTAPSGMSAAAALTARTLGLAIASTLACDGGFAARSCGLGGGEGERQRTHAILARRRGSAAACDGVLEQPDRARVEILVHQLQWNGAVGGAQYD